MVIEAVEQQSFFLLNRALVKADERPFFRGRPFNFFDERYNYAQDAVR